MAFPTSPTNGQQATINGITYTYSTTNGTWTRVPGTVSDTWVRTQANSAYTQANTATADASTADSKAVTSGSYANSSFGVANSAAVYANAAFIKANTALAQANAIFTAAPRSSGSVLLNGSSQYLNTTGIDLTSTSTFTLESWIYLTSTSASQQTISTTRAFAAANGWEMRLTSARIVQFYFTGVTFTGSINSTTTIALNTWYHLALVRSGSSATLYVNGVAESTVTGVTNGTTGTDTYIGNQSGGSYYFNGNISNLRIVQGTAVYTSNFAPSTVPLTSTQYANVNGYPSAAITGTGTSLLLNTVDGAGFLTDSSGNNLTLTNVGSATSSNNAPSWEPVFLGGAYIQANAAFLQANTPSATANSAALYANAAFIQANAAYAQANSGGAGTDTYARDTANASFVQANAAFVKANTTSGNGVVRVVTVADITTITMNANTSDIVIQTNTQLAGTLTVATSGTPLEGQKIILRLQSANVQTFSWDTVFAGSTDMILPTVSSAGNKYDYMGFIYNSISTKWQLIAKNFGF